MSVVTSQYITSPTGESEIASRFEINDAREEFTLFGVTNVGEEYTLSFWVRSEVAGSIIVNGSVLESSTEWQRHSVTFTATSTDLVFDFDATGTYYIYHTKLEIGNVMTEWTEAPEDVEDDISNATDRANAAQQTADDAVKKVGLAEATIQMLSDRIQTLVRDENGASLMTQVGGEWVFNMGTYNKTLADVSNNLNTLSKDLGSTESTVKALNSAVNNLGVMTEYVVIGTYNNQPCIELGKIDSNFKVRITNTEIQFIDGNTVPAYLSNQKLMIEKAEVKNELQFGGFVWNTRANGNMGIVWKGVGS